mmetsp:Transcript_12116/g.26899  ORF Transcript_12116/g.26899 Transcript_12116/m.26899 type:complete len:1112 (-) Transcript_12116:170-3505(-)
MAMERKFGGVRAVGSRRPASLGLKPLLAAETMVLLTALGTASAFLMAPAQSEGGGFSGLRPRHHAAAPVEGAENLSQDSEGYGIACGGAVLFAAVALASAGTVISRSQRRQNAPEAKFTTTSALPRKATAALGAPLSPPVLVPMAQSSCGTFATVASSPSSSAAFNSSTSSSFIGHGAPSSRGLLRPSSSIARGSAVTRMAMMFERFTEKTIKAVMMAQAESRRLGQDTVGAAMLVVGIVLEGGDVGARALLRLGATAMDAKTALQDVVGTGEGGKQSEIPFTADAKRVLEDAMEIARDQGSPTVGTVHLLRAVLKQDGPAAKVLMLLVDCKDMDEVREKVGQAIDREEGTLNASQGASNRPGTSDSAARGKPASSEVDLTNTLKFGQDLTAMAREGKLEPLVGREEELRRTVRILGRRSKNNPVLVGEAGVGKTSIAHGLAQRIAEGRVPMSLRKKIVIQLDLALLLAGTRYRGDFEERLRAVVGEVTASERRVILVIDEVHTLVGAGGGGGAEGGGMDAANLLKPALARGELQCIGATTMDEYRKYIEKDPALERRFQPVTVPEPTEEETLQILMGLAPKYERHHQLQYTPEALAAAVKLSAQFIADRHLPDKAIDVMDEAGSKVRQQLYQDDEDEDVAAERRALLEALEDLKSKKQTAVATERYDEAQQLKVREVELAERLDVLENAPRGVGAADQRVVEELTALKAQIQEAVAAERFDEAHSLKARETEAMGRLKKAPAPVDQFVTEEDMAQVVAGWTGIPVEQVGATESSRLLHLEEELHQSIVGQEEAVRSISRSLRRARAGLRNPARPIAGFMFSGPTGVGKTELCKTLSSKFFGSEESMIRVDMSEYMEKHTVSKLIGAPPGYVGYSDGGTLTEAIRRRPYSLVLFDEVEKAHPDVFNLMLQLLDDGRLTDSKGRTVSFANCLVVMTSNLGSRSVQKGAEGLSLGFGTAEDEEEESHSRVKELVIEEMKSFFRPEFLNRLDEIVVFRSLRREDVRRIAEVEFARVIARLSEAELDVTLTDRFKERVLQNGFDPAYGARPLKRAITRMLEDTLAEHVLSAVDGAHDTVGAKAQRRCVELDVEANGEVRVVCSTSAAVAGARPRL